MSNRNKYFLAGVVVILTSIILVQNVTSTMNFYSATEAKSTLSTAIVGIDNERIVEYAYTTSFFFEFDIEVWNSYPAKQKVLTKTECGLQLEVDYNTTEGIFSIPEVVPIDGECKTIPTDVVYEAGINKETILLGMKFNYVGIDKMPDGVYTFEFGHGVSEKFQDKIHKMYKTEIIVVGGFIISVILPDLPENWGSLETATLPIPIQNTFIPAIFIIAVFSKIRKLK